MPFPIRVLLRELIPVVRPDVIVLETLLPDGSGIDFCRELARSEPGVRCLFFTADTDPRSMAQALAAGATGYLFKEALGARVNEAIGLVAAGRSLLQPALNNQPLPGRAGARDDRPAVVPVREDGEELCVRAVRHARGAAVAMEPGVGALHDQSRLGIELFRMPDAGCRMTATT